MKRIAMTGGIASGKSTVARLILETGTPLMDADDLCRRVMSKGSDVTQAIGRRWPSVMHDGHIDRRALGKILFSDATARREEEALVLPAIQSEFEAWSKTLAHEGKNLCVYDAALIFEHELQGNFDGVLLVTAPKEVQLERLMVRDGLSLAEAHSRLAAQMPMEEKRQLATWVLENDGTLESLRLNFQKLWPLISA